MKKTTFRFGISASLLLLITGIAVQTFSHCQIPCGIYDDQTQFVIMNEHITTIEKSMNQINALANEQADKNVNQLVRWVQNKENHADAFTEIVTHYFLTQRIKPAESSDKAAYEDYTQKLVLLHKMMVHAMKAKQTTDLQEIETLRNLVHEFHEAYGSK